MTTGVPIELSERFVLSPFFGEGGGLSTVSGDWEYGSQESLTELGREFIDSHLGISQYMGANLSFGKHFGLAYTYDIRSIPEGHFWHTTISEKLRGALMHSLPLFFGRKYVSEDIRSSLAYRVGELAFKGFFALWWDDFTSDHANWPFNDNPIFRYRRHMLTLSGRF